MPDFTEIDDHDWQNLSVVGYGSVVYASGNNGLWKTTDGGDGSLSAAMLAPQHALGHSQFTHYPDTLIVTGCSQSSMELYNQNSGCSYGKFDSISIIGLDPSEYSVFSTHYCSCLPMQDTSFITLQPKDTGTRVVTIDYHFTDDEYHQIATSIMFTLVVSQGSTPIALNFSFNPTNITTHPGDTISIPAYLSGNATLGATSITLPFGIDTNVLQPIGFYPAISGITAGSIIYAGGLGTVPLQADSLVLNGATLIGTLRCIVYLGDTLAMSVTLQNASLTSANFPCVALSLTMDTENITIGTASVLQFMNTAQIQFGIQSIAPYPASGVVGISFINPLSSSILYQVIDVLGTVRATGEVSDDELALDVHSLANGLYYLRARDEETGIAVSGRFMIER
jgi:hypothetical protein